MAQKFHRVKSFRGDVDSFRLKGFPKGYSCGFNTGEDIISYKLGHFSFIYSFPGVGKTTFAFEQLLWLAHKFHQNSLIYSPETGNKEEIVANLVMIYLGKIMYGDNKVIIPQKEWDDAVSFIDEHFIILSAEEYELDKSLVTLDDIYGTVPQLCQEHEMDINNVLIDPANNVDPTDSMARLALYLQTRQALRFIRGASKRLGVHTFLISHLRDVDKMGYDKETDQEYYPIPKPHMLMNGQENWRLAEQMIALWQPPVGVANKAGTYIYRENEMHVICQKSKPVGVGRKGQFTLYWDPGTFKYYEEIDDNKYYIGERDHGKRPDGSKLTTNAKWESILKTLPKDEFPF